MAKREPPQAEQPPSDPATGGNRAKTVRATVKGNGGSKKRKTACAEEPIVPIEIKPFTPEADALRELEAAIQLRRSHFAARCERVAEMRSSATALRARAGCLRRVRATIKASHTLSAKADRLEHEALNIEQDRERATFEARVALYLERARANADKERALIEANATAPSLLPSSLAPPLGPFHDRQQRPLASPVRPVKKGGGAGKAATAKRQRATAAAAAAAAAAMTPTVAPPNQTNRALLCEYHTEFERQAPPMHIVQHDACPACGVPLLLAVNGALLTCPGCRMGLPYIDATTASMAYGDEVEFVPNNPKKAHHFEDRLKLFQGKGSKRITKKVIDTVMQWHLDQGIIEVDDITTTTVRMALKANNLKDLYDYEINIWCRITGKPAPTLGPTRETYCRNMFARIQAPFLKWKARINPTRINFLSYGYVLYKIFQLLSWNEYLPYFTLLKGRDKLEKQEEIWEGICHEVRWTFIPAPAAPLAPTSLRLASAAAKRALACKDHAHKRDDDDGGSSGAVQSNRQEAGTRPDQEALPLSHPEDPFPSAHREDAAPVPPKGTTEENESPDGAVPRPSHEHARAPMAVERSGALKTRLTGRPISRALDIRSKALGVAPVRVPTLMNKVVAAGSRRTSRVPMIRSC